MDITAGAELANLVIEDACLDAEKIRGVDAVGCTFRRCTFHESGLLEWRLEDCRLEDCDLSNAKLTDSAFVDVLLVRCKLLGVDFSPVRRVRFDVRFEDCELSYASFNSLDLRHVSADGSKMVRVDFSAANLSKVSWTQCDLTGATFNRTDLRIADLSTCTGVALNPQDNQVKGLRLSLEDGIACLAAVGIEVLPHG